MDLSALGLEGVVRLQGADFNLGIVFLLASASLGVYGVTLGGWASNSKYSFFGGLRAGAQMISYEIPMGICLLCVVLASGTLRMDEVIRQQTDHGWFLLHMPLPAIMFYICMLAEANRPMNQFTGPLFRVLVLYDGRHGTQHTRLILNFHHLIDDGGSVGIFFDELYPLYNAMADGRSMDNSY